MKNSNFLVISDVESYTEKCFNTYSNNKLKQLHTCLYHEGSLTEACFLYLLPSVVLKY